MPWKPLAIILAVLLLAAFVVIALIGFELTDFSFSLF
jgi:predicted outer membrane lipoprotein